MPNDDRTLRWFKAGLISGTAAHLILWLPYFPDVHMSPWPDVLEGSFYPRVFPGLVQAVHRLSSAVSAALIPLGHAGFVLSAGVVYPALFIYLGGLELGALFAALGFLLRRGGIPPLKRLPSLAVSAGLLAVLVGAAHLLPGRKAFALASAGAVIVSAALALLLGGDPAMTQAAQAARDVRRRVYGFFQLAAVIGAVVLLAPPARADQAATPAKPASIADANKAEGARYAAGVAQKYKVKPGADGLVFISKEEGAGPRPAKTDVVKVDYEGRLVDGTLFDSSYRSGHPVQFPLDHVIPCWTEALQKMRVGGRARVLCPSSIAYGDDGSPPNIPPGALLDFTIELHDVVH